MDDVKISDTQAVVLRCLDKDRDQRFGNVEELERALAAKPRISVPTIVLHGDGSGLSQLESSIAHLCSHLPGVSV